MPLSNKKIIIISPEQWGNNFVSKHYYAHYLSKENEVYFLNPPKPWNFKNLLSRKIEKRKVQNGLWEINFPFILPRLNLLPKWAQAFFFGKQVRQIQKQLGIVEFDIVWSFTPLIYWNLGAWKTKKRMFHKVDFHPNANCEKDICKSADVVIGVAETITERLQKYNPNTFKVGHGAALEHFESATGSFNLPGKNKIKVGYIGNMHQKIDYDVLLDIATKHENVDFVFIGPYGNSNLSDLNEAKLPSFHTLFDKENCYFLGEVPPSHLVGYVKLFDINLVTLIDKNGLIHSTPHKTMVYFYVGHVTVSTYFKEYADKPFLVEMVEKNEDFAETFNKVVSQLDVYNSVDLKNKRKQFTYENSYETHINTIDGLLNAN